MAFYCTPENARFFANHPGWFCGCPFCYSSHYAKPPTPRPRFEWVIDYGQYTDTGEPLITCNNG